MKRKLAAGDIVDLIKRKNEIEAILSRNPKRGAITVLAMLYSALVKEGWEEGPTDKEAISAAQDWFENRYGSDKDSDEGMKKIALGGL